MNETGILLSLLLFTSIASFIFYNVSADLCPNLQEELNTTVSWNETRFETENLGWYDKAKLFYDRITLTNCANLPTWYSYIFYVPTIVVSIYILARLIRGGG